MQQQRDSDSLQRYIAGEEFITNYEGSNEGYHSTGSSGRPSPHHHFDRSPLPSR